MAEQKAMKRRGLMEMPQAAARKTFTAEEDITTTREDGRVIVVARKGTTVRADQLERFGVTGAAVSEPEPAGEVKAEAPTENKSGAPAGAAAKRTKVGSK